MGPPSEEGGCRLPTTHLPRRLRHLDPSQSKILGTPLFLNGTIPDPIGLP